MAPKPSVKRTKSTLEHDEQVEYALQAVVLCDIDSDKFSPLDPDVKPILLPLAGTPILAYTLELLERAGVEDIILFCSRQTAELQSYLSSTRWGAAGYHGKVRVVTAAAAHSTGDALREIDRLGLVKADFVLIRGGILSNLPLQFMVEEHRRRKEDDGDELLMTVVLMQSDTKSAFSSRRHLREARLHVLESLASATTDYDFHRCLMSEHIDVHPDRTQFVQLSKEITAHHTDVLFRNDLYDCNIEICSPEVPALFTENFDYDDLRRDFVNGVLTSDLIAKKIYCYIPKSGYGGNISSFEDYWRVSIDMAKGLTAPFDPSMNIEGDNAFSQRASIWRDRDVKIGKTVQSRNVVIGKGSIIADGVSIENSIIGRNCQILGGTIKQSFLQDNVTVQAGCNISKSIVFSDNTILRDTHLGPGTIILPHTRLPESTNISAHTRFTIIDSTGHTLLLPHDSDDSDDEDQDDIPIEALNLSDSDISEIGSDSDADSDTPSTSRRRRSSASGFSDTPSTNHEFYAEAEESLSRAFLENHSVDNAAIELKTLRMATNVTFHEVREAIISALMNVYITTPAKAAKLFKKWGGLLHKFEEDAEAEVDSVMIMQRFFARRLRKNAQSLAEINKFVLGLQGMYNSDVFTEKTIFTWFEDERSKGVGEKAVEDMLSLKNAAQKLVTWLNEADEDSDEEEESDEE